MVPSRKSMNIIIIGIVAAGAMTIIVGVIRYR